MILFIKHIEIEGPETLAPFFKNKGFSLKTIDLSQGDCLSQDFSQFEAVICLGGPMNVYEEEKFPFLRKENDFIKRILEADIPFLGICLGSQLLAKACNAKITKSPNKEIGFSKITLTQEGKRDPLFKGLGSEIEVFQWHEDTFAIPQEAQLLATSEECPHQVFRVGRCAYGLQFHIEITDKSIHDWTQAYFKKDDEALQQKYQAMLRDYKQRKENFHSQAERIYNNLLCFVLPSPKSTRPSAI